MKTKNRNIIIILALLSLHFNSCEAIIKHIKTENHKVYGNCEMCKKHIEKAAYEKNKAKAVWNETSKMATLSFDSTITNADAILRRIAYAGYDNDKFIAPNDAYANLPECCQYARMNTPIAKSKTASVIDDTAKQTRIDTLKSSNVNPFAEIYTAYFALKDALTKDDGAAASSKAKLLYDAINNVAMEKLSSTEHQVWMKYEKQLAYDAEHIKGVDKVDHQREHFITLSKNIYEVMKAIKIDTIVYYDFCPMADDGKGATWLSLQKPINNPYMGKSMPTCGKVQAIISK